MLKFVVALVCAIAIPVAAAPKAKEPDFVSKFRKEFMDEVKSHKGDPKKCSVKMVDKSEDGQLVAVEVKCSDQPNMCLFIITKDGLADFPMCAPNPEFVETIKIEGK